MNHLPDSLLNEFLDGALPEEQVRTAQIHLSGCRACRSRLDDLRQVAGSLAALPDQSLARDLTPSVLAGLPEKKPALGWRLFLVLQGSIALGLTPLAAAQVSSWIRSWLPRLDLPALRFPEFRLPAFSPPALHIPAMQMPVLRLPALHLPGLRLEGLDLSGLHLLLLAAGAAALFVVGNSLLLRRTSQTETSRRNK